MGRPKLTLEEMQKLAEERGGKCLSTEYEGIYVPLIWQCKEGHIWEATPNSIKNGHWCPVCAVNGHSGSRRKSTKAIKRPARDKGSNRAVLTLEDMRKLAGERGGKCLSPVYIGTARKHIWQCAQGHIWEATPASVKNGHWCPVCAMAKNSLLGP